MSPLLPNELPAPFELKVMALALRGQADWLVGARKQLSHLTVSNRRLTGGGFVTDFQCNEGAIAVRVPKQLNGLPDLSYPPAINARRNLPTPGLVSFIVWLDMNGLITQLEACSLTDDLWPNDLFGGFSDFEDDAGNIITP